MATNDGTHMGTPKGMRCMQVPLRGNHAIHLYSNAEQIILQARRNTPTDEDVMTSSFKIAIPLRTEDALQIANELLIIASSRLRKQAGHHGSETGEPNGNASNNGHQGRRGSPKSMLDDDSDDIPF